ncbi:MULTISPECIES: YlxQ-related RNA-binding protein [Enterococcus]|uniref:50S ribosomal protein L7Ae n=1 Tax=Candidatus Enterococcus mangumiae TaxID=2230878 RepID=A0ABZ2T580_9ENTE|nr:MULTISPECIES: YlxQ-related RNA-binding protein [unclassified Enterococcus]MBO0461858.1 YlxQ-related RNA-binding protein [Enterococcus sp. DIV1298c]MBO0490452.1 YlxQ-related RNA-binding protein [Enterococcus sp. DIV1094]MBO1300450.1 YlxQ-related RNA-binding protein [Enterococcus sp. DIV1271a]
MSQVNRQKAMNLIGLAMRAGKMITGEELTIGEIRRQKAKIVFVASDASENTRKKIKDKSSYYEVPCFELFSEEEITQMIGKPRKVIGITDAGFAKRVKELIEG